MCPFFVFHTRLQKIYRKTAKAMLWVQNNNKIKFHVSFRQRAKDQRAAG